jgi:histidine triad (HIT) family protein
MSYDKENIFAKILRGEIPCDKIYEDEYILSFKDISPQAKTHVLIIPKDPYIDVSDFLQNADNQYQTNFWQSVNKVIFRLKPTREKTEDKKSSISIYIF